MPPETKPIISKLEEMVCRNCIYYTHNNGLEICANPDSDTCDFDKEESCSKGKWLTGRQYPSDFESELNLEDYDDAYYGIVRAQMFPDAVSITDEHHIRQGIMKALDKLIIEPQLTYMIAEQIKLIKLDLIKLWGEQE
mgnify:CR=1 FL=1